MENKKFKEQIVVYSINLECDINIVDPDTNDPSEICIWLDDTDITNITNDNEYHNVTEQMALISSAVRGRVSHLCYHHGIEITCECFGVKDGRMYILYFGICK